MSVSSMNGFGIEARILEQSSCRGLALECWVKGGFFRASFMNFDTASSLYKT